MFLKFFKLKKNVKPFKPRLLAVKTKPNRFKKPKPKLNRTEPLKPLSRYAAVSQFGSVPTEPLPIVNVTNKVMLHMKI